jgi:hypothetical protein
MSDSSRQSGQGLDANRVLGKLPFSSAMEQNVYTPESTARDLDYPQREAAFFYGLFLRGHSAENLRRDIAVPAEVLAKWHREAEREPQLRDILSRMVEFRRHVLAIFEALVGRSSQPQRIQ